MAFWCRHLSLLDRGYICKMKKCFSVLFYMWPPLKMFYKCFANVLVFYVTCNHLLSDGSQQYDDTVPAY